MRAFLAVMTIVVGGCAVTPQPQHWAKPGATQEAFMKDRYACLQQTPQDRPGVYNTTIFISCMGARGYKEEPNGDLSPPTEAVARMSSPNPLTAVGQATQEAAAAGSPTLAARRDYEKAVANYQACLATNPSNPNACEGQRNIMNADAQVLSAPNISQQSNVYVGH